jgi:hypothetical protein
LPVYILQVLTNVRALSTLDLSGSPVSPQVKMPPRLESIAIHHPPADVQLLLGQCRELKTATLQIAEGWTQDYIKALIWNLRALNIDEIILHIPTHGDNFLYLSRFWIDHAALASTEVKFFSDMPKGGHKIEIRKIRRG